MLKRNRMHRLCYIFTTTTRLRLAVGIICAMAHHVLLKLDTDGFNQALSIIENSIRKNIQQLL